MADRSVVTVAASAARTETGNSGSIQVPPGSPNLALLVDVTAQSGVTPTLDFSVEWSNDGTTFAAADTADTFAQITGAQVPRQRAKSFAVKGKRFRVVWTIAGTTPSFTFSASAYGV